MSELPQFWFGDYKFVDRSIKMGAGTVQPTFVPNGYWSTDFSLYTDEGNTIRSSHRPMHNTLRDADDTYAATFNQWGLWLNALLDVAADEGALVRLSEPYNPLAKHAPLKADGARYESSAELFHHRTCGQFSKDMRQRQAVSLSCVQHKWVPSDIGGGWPESGISRCTKCGHLHRFGV